jgi:hypothetical protein
MRATPRSRGPGSRAPSPAPTLLHAALLPAHSTYHRRRVDALHPAWVRGRPRRATADARSPRARLAPASDVESRLQQWEEEKSAAWVERRQVRRASAALTQRKRGGRGGGTPLRAAHRGLPGSARRGSAACGSSGRWLQQGLLLRQRAGIPLGPSPSRSVAGRSSSGRPARGAAWPHRAWPAASRVVHSSGRAQRSRDVL